MRIERRTNTPRKTTGGLVYDVCVEDMRGGGSGGCGAKCTLGRCRVVVLLRDSSGVEGDGGRPEHCHAHRCRWVSSSLVWSNRARGLGDRRSNSEMRNWNWVGKVGYSPNMIAGGLAT